MKILTLRCAGLALAFASVSTLAGAQLAHSIKSVNLRAGPARGYPLVGQFGPDTGLQVQGCTERYTWCDVVGPGGLRGWVFAPNIAYLPPPRSGVSYNVDPWFGVPILAFVIGDYWGQHYRDRSWYGDRQRWAPRDRPVINQPPPRPAPPVHRDPPDRREPPAWQRAGAVPGPFGRSEPSNGPPSRPPHGVTVTPPPSRPAGPPARQPDSPGRSGEAPGHQREAPGLQREPPGQRGRSGDEPGRR